MRHLQALCAVLETNLAALAGDGIEIAETAREQLILKQFRSMTLEQQSAFLALASTIGAPAYPSLDESPNPAHTVHEPNKRGSK